MVALDIKVIYEGLNDSMLEHCCRVEMDRIQAFIFQLTLIHISKTFPKAIGTHLSPGNGRTRLQKTPSPS